MKNRWLVLSLVFALCAFCSSSALAQETTGGLQGTVKDPSGAIVPHVKVLVTSDALGASKEIETDGNGYYRFANLPPGTYTITATVKGFRTVKQGGLIIEVGHLPTVDLTLEVGTSETVVEVTSEAPQIDVTTNVTQTNVTEDVILNIPHGRSFQSVIQFAPSARNEPLMGNTVAGGYSGGGTGGSSPGSIANGSDHGFSVAGGSDSENSYLVEGQETANLIGGYSHTSVPFDFIQEVEIKNSGIEAAHGGALGGVVNVIMKKGTNNYHGSIFAQFENYGMDGPPPTYDRYDPTSSQALGGPGGATACKLAGTCWGFLDPNFQEYQPKQDKTSDVFPGFTFGGPILKNRLFGFVAFNPEFYDLERKVDYNQPGGLGGLGVVAFSQNTQTYYGMGRIDAVVSQKIRLYGSWLYQLQKQSGENLPNADSKTGAFNVSSAVAPGAFAHGVGYTAPNTTTNIGADFTITPRLVATTRFGYYFENYHDFGLPTTGTLTVWQTNGVGATDAFGAPLPASLQQANGFQNLAFSQNFTNHNASKGIQFDQDLAWFKSGWKGTHNIKFGYQLNRLNNAIAQRYNVPLVQPFVGGSSFYTPFGPVGAANCAAVEAADGTTTCQGQFGYVNILDYGSGGQATSFNHSLFVQDSWSIARGFTINAGLRVEREYLPAENQPGGGITHPIDFGWGSKIAPRIGIAWDPLRNGKIKIFGGYGQFYDQMKLNLAISSFGGQYWSNCYYALDTSNVASIAPVYNSSTRYCGGIGTTSASPANFGGTTPAGLTFLENNNFRTNPTTCSTCTITEEGVAPGLKPYKQHEMTAGIDYQITPTLAFEARYDRRRLDHVIEDSALVNPAIGETFVIVNPGQGVNSTYDKFFNFLYGVTNSNCGSACPNTIPAQRNYDGLEFRLMKAPTKHWSGMFSYTYSKLYGNYTGLTSSDQADGGGGRNAPNNSRSFDEPMFSWNANGSSSSGLLPTDRPNTFKGYAYYELGWMRKFTTDFGIFQVMYQGSPLTSYLDVGNSFPSGLTGGAFPVDVVNRGKWVNVTQNPTTGLITVGTPYTKRTPWYDQTDFNFQQNYKIGESKALSFSATFTNLLNQRSVTQVEGNISSGFSANYIAPGGSFLVSPTVGLVGGTSAGTPFYAAVFHPYDFAALMNAAPTNSNCTPPNGTATTPNTIALPNTCGPLTVNSGYGLPNRYQASRTIRLGVRFTF
jgi:Carboxypeptidase regulatory-like domain